MPTMSSQQQPQSMRQAQESHQKDPSLNYVSQGSTSSTTTTTTTATSTVITSTTPDIPSNPIAVYEDIPRRPYPLKPSTKKAATAYTLFSSNTHAFDIDYIHNSKKHYLSSSLSGKIWWDVNGDAKRGDYANFTLNDMEYDYGLPNVGNIFLISCDEDGMKSGSTTSQLYNGRDAIPLKQSLDKKSGMYEFQEFDTIPSGRYYVMFEAPRGWRVSGNMLPLGRKEGFKDGEVYYECVAEGGEGTSFKEKAEESGDFDYGGYCGRTIGCFEIGTEAELKSKFEDLEAIEETEYYRDVIQGDTDAARSFAKMGGKMVAFPETHVMDVGMFDENWPLPAKQYVDAMVTLKFPVSSEGSEEDILQALLSSEFADPESFGSSMNREAVSKTLFMNLADQFVYMSSGGHLQTGEEFTEAQKFAANGSNTSAKNEKEPAAFSESDKDMSEAEYFAKPKSQAAIFALDGVDLYDAKIERKKHKKDAIDQLVGRYLRASRRDQETDESEFIEITYTFTAQGTYNPPPHEQLGYFVQNSINANPADLVRSLREDKTLPFQDIISAESSHLTVGPPPPKVCTGCFGLQAIVALDEGGLKSWATVPIILISLMIGGLTFVFFGRRLWKRRAYLDGDDMACEMKTSEFNNCTLTDEDIVEAKAAHRLEGIGESDNSFDGSKKAKKKKSKKKLKDNPGSSDRTSSLRSLDLTDDESSLHKHKIKQNKIDASDSSGQSGSSIEGSLDEIDAALAKISKKHSKKKLLDGSNRSGASDNSGGTSSLDQDQYQDETAEERRKRRKKEKKAKKKAEMMSAMSLEELRLQQLSARKMTVRFEDD
ncbi:hypothetical protein ACHAXN_007418 [Cyclotella atomus]